MQVKNLCDIAYQKLVRKYVATIAIIENAEVATHH